MDMVKKGTLAHVDKNLLVSPTESNRSVVLLINRSLSGINISSPSESKHAQYLFDLIGENRVSLTFRT